MRGDIDNAGVQRVLATICFNHHRHRTPLHRNGFQHIVKLAVDRNIGPGHVELLGKN